MSFIIDRRLLLFLSLGFMGATVIGTVSHELGHYMAASIMGFDARINYGMTWLTSNKQMSFTQDIWFTLGGPLQTMLTGTIGFFYLYSSPRHVSRLSAVQWIFVFMSLFWLRQSANFIVGIGTYLLKGQIGEHGDEIRLSKYFDWPDWSIVSVTAIVGLLVLTFVIFKVIPKPLRLTFLLSGLVGGVSGYLLWLVYLGKVLMP